MNLEDHRHARSETQALVDLIEDLRADLEAEVPMKLHKWSGGGSSTKGMPSEDMGGVEEVHASGVAGIGWTGLPFTPPFERYLGHAENYGFQFIAAASIEEVGAYCRSHHDESHWNTGPTDSLCRRMVVAVVEMRQPLTFVAVVEDQSVFAVRKFLVDVLRHAAEWRGDKRNLATQHDTQSEPSSDPIGDLLRIQHQEDAERRVWNLLRLKHPYLSDWETERLRRIDQHRKLGCARCMTAAA